MSTEKILIEARERLRRCQSYESSARENWKADYRFGHGDSVNLYQWEGDSVDTRSTAGKPCFTVNETRNYCMQIVNDSKQNKAQIQIRAVGNGASFQAATILEGVCRHIEQISNAELCYEQGAYDQTFAGLGYWRIVTDYAHDDSFDQEIFIRPIKNTLSVFLDPYIQQIDGSDATFAFIVTEMDKDEFKRDYPRYKNQITDTPFGGGTEDYNMPLRENRVHVMEYFRKTADTDTLHMMPDGTTARESELVEKGMHPTKINSLDQRNVSRPKVEWYLIMGDQIIDQNEFPSQYIPIVRVIGTETVIDGELDRFGHVRGLRDSNRAYNYYTSAGIEFVANQTKSPWLADVRSIEGVEEYWRDSNIKAYAVLPYKGVADDGTPLGPPQRADPPVYASAFLDGMKVAQGEMQMASSQPPAVMGEQGNERSGKSIVERQRAAANSTYHFVNNLSTAIRFTGKIIIDMLPRVYDTKRVLKILAQDGAMQTIQVDPAAEQAHQPMQGLDGESFDPQQVAHVLNPSIGQYDVVAEVGPQYSTRREEFVSATMDILAQNESLTPLIGDLVFRNFDFPGASQIADRMRRMVPPQALGTTDPHIQQLQQQLAQQHGVIVNLAHELQMAKNKAESVAFMKDIDLMRAVTERMKVFGGIDEQAMRPLIREEVSKLIGIPVNAAIAMHLKEDALMTQDTAMLVQQATQAAQAQSGGQQPPQGPPLGPPQQ